MQSGLKDPLSVARVVCELERRMAVQGLTVELSTDFNALAAFRERNRGARITPLFDCKIADIDGFWLKLTNADGGEVGMGAYRIDTVDSNLADWALGWILGHYIKRGELILPAEFKPPMGSKTETLRGRIVYYGELWHHSSVRKTGLLELFPRFGHFLCMLKWHPDAIWGLAGYDMAMRGRVTRISFPRLERNFLRWRHQPGDADSNEWISIADRDDLEFLVADELTRLDCAHG